MSAEGYLNIEGLSRGTVMAALYNAARVQGMGFMQYRPSPMTAEQGEEYLSKYGTYLDYVYGRVMKVRLDGVAFHPGGYDRDNGEGAASSVIRILRETGDVNHYYIRALHEEHSHDAALEVLANLGEETKIEELSDHVASISLGYADVAEQLRPKLTSFLSPTGGAFGEEEA